MKHRMQGIALTVVALAVAGCASTQASTTVARSRHTRARSRQVTPSRRESAAVAASEGWYRGCKLRMMSRPVYEVVEEGLDLELKDVGGRRSCTITGYPTVTVLSSKHGAIRQALSRGGDPGLAGQPLHVKRVLVSRHRTAVFALSFSGVTMSGPGVVNFCGNFRFVRASWRGLSHALTARVPGRAASACGGSHGVAISVSPIGQVLKVRIEDGETVLLVGNS